MKSKIITILLLLIIAFSIVTLSGCREDKLTKEDILKGYENVELGKSGYSDGDIASPPYYIRFYAPQSIFDLTKGSVIIQYYYRHYTDWEEEMASEGYAEREPW
ncbi:MAG: hypothetical protein J6A99_01610, partial [Clostridia bacterium]|nr:hypothetical protein [Clostridia bacterium]